MRLILVRHGNTHESGSIAFWTGATEDLPLVEKGRAQAQQFGRALKDGGITVTAWYSGPLIRHRQFSEIAVKAMVSECYPIEPKIDARLNEIDYGSWAGFTLEQIKAKFGAQVQEDWAMHSIWPAAGGWKPPVDQLRAEIAAFLNDLIGQYKDNDTVVAVSSGGRLRYFLEAVSGEFEKHCKNNDVKISTGHVCIYDYAEGNWSLSCWNVEPTADLFTRQCLAST